MLNEYDNCKDRTQNFKEHRKEMQDFSIAYIVRAIEFITTLSQLVPEGNEVAGNTEYILEPLCEIANKLKTDMPCMKCGEVLYKSDLPQYDYICTVCDENF